MPETFLVERTEHVLTLTLNRPEQRNAFNDPMRHEMSAFWTEVREDRSVFFGTIDSRVKEITYQIKPCNRGEFVVPPIFAESMYDRNVKGCGVAGKARPASERSRARAVP